MLRLQPGIAFIAQRALIVEQRPRGDRQGFAVLLAQQAAIVTDVLCRDSEAARRQFAVIIVKRRRSLNPECTARHRGALGADIRLRRGQRDGIG
ncbi:hypothetical protein BW31_02004 [Pantoea agglomerans]|nr:hypothetical protein BW31_02004 [Pantoea agglomerans]